jgi:amidase
MERRTFLAGAAATALVANSSGHANTLVRSETMAFDTYATYDGLGLGALVQRGEVSALELLEIAIARAEAINPRINAIVYRGYDQARAAAAAFKPAGEPFAGVPLVLKDLLGDCAGMPTRFASAFVPPMPAPADSYLVARLKRAGFVPFAKTNAPEFGLPPFTEPKLYGAARNPWDLTRTPGGSSGGSAAAVAARIVPVAHANDGGGSIRIPAACCGLVGLKPTRGRNSLGPLVGDIMNGLVVEHVVCRSVRDTAAALDATAGYMAGDPYAASAPARPYLTELGGAPRRLRIGYSTATPYGNSLDPEIAAATDATARLCAALGHEVEEASFNLDAQTLLPAFFAVYSAGLAATIDVVAKLIGRAPSASDFEAMTWNIYQIGRAVTASQYLMAVGVLQQSGRAFAAFFEHRDIWLTPSLSALPLPVGLINVDDPNARLADPRIPAFAHYNPLYNVSGQPAISLPLQVSKSGLPIGMLFGARYGEEATLLHLAAQLETAQPWHDRQPKLID